jgi:hypothetical protein
LRERIEVDLAEYRLDGCVILRRVLHENAGRCHRIERGKPFQPDALRRILDRAAETGYKMSRATRSSMNCRR